MKKPSKTVDAKSVLDDIKAGMSDSAIMEKYRLSAAGLESLLRKLYESETVRQIRAMEVVRDFVAGMSNNQLVEKYKLSEETLNTVLEHGEQAPFFNETIDTGITAREGVISGKEIIQDLRSGMTRWELMLKYRLSGAQLKKALQIVLGERQKVAVEMAADVRSGLTGAQLMQKYHLSTSGLRKVCQKLLQDGLLGTLEIQGLKLPLDDGASVHKERRQIPRRVPSFKITVSDRGNEGVRGTVKDVTEKGLAVKGIEAHTGERKTLWILGDDLGIIDPFELEAECAWVRSERSKERSVAGFQVVAISDEDLQKLQQLIKLLDLRTEVTS